MPLESRITSAWKPCEGRLEKIIISSQSKSAHVLKKLEHNINIACVNVKSLPKLKKRKKTR